MEGIKLQLPLIYLAIVLFLQIELTIQTVLLASIPLIALSISIYLKNTKLGLLGMFFFYIVSISQIVIPNMEDFVFVLIEIILLVLPSIIVLSIIFQLKNQEIFYPSKTKKPLLIAALLLITIIGIFYLLTFFFGSEFLFTKESVEGQILILTAISIACCTPFLVGKN